MPIPKNTDIKVEQIGNGYLLTLGNRRLFALDPASAGEMVTMHLQACKAHELAELERLVKKGDPNDDI